MTAGARRSSRGPGQISGTPAYVAPELADGARSFTPAVDVFSFGVVAYDLLTGKMPYIEPPFLMRLDGRAIPGHQHLSAACPQLSLDLANALDACLAPVAVDRPGVDDLVARVEKELASTTSPPGGHAMIADPG